MRDRCWGTIIGLCIIIGTLAHPCVAVENEPFIRLTTDGKCSMGNWGMVAPVTGRIAFYRKTLGKKQLIVADGDGMNEIVVDQIGSPGNATWSPDGTCIAYTWHAGSGGNPERALKVWRYGERSPNTLAKGTANYGQFVWSRNGRYLATRKSRPDSNRVIISVLDTVSGRETHLGANHQDCGTWQYAGSWSPDSTRLCFVSKQAQEDPYGLWICSVDGTHLRRLTPRDCMVDDVQWKSDPDVIVFTAHYKRVESSTSAKDIWLISPTGKELRPLTNGSSPDWQRRYSYELHNRGADGRYLAGWVGYPDPARRQSATGWFCADVKTGEAMVALGADIASRRREVGDATWEMSPDGRRFFVQWPESEIRNLGSRDEALGTTWWVAAVYDVPSRTSRELVRLQTDTTRTQLSGWPGFSPDGRRIYFTVQKVISESEGLYDSDVAYIDIDELPQISPTTQLPKSEKPAAAPAQAAAPAAPTDDGAVRLQVMNIRADEALSMLADRYQSVVKADIKRNCLLVTAPPDVRAALERDLRTIDVPAPQIAVDVLVIELSKQGARDLGLDMTYSKGRWAALLPIGQSSRLGPVDEDGIPLFPSNPSGLGEVIYQGVGELPRTFFAHLQALESSGDARIEASPTVVATSGKEAIITVRQRVNFFYTTGYDIYGRPTLAKSDISADINMKILPVLLGNGKVQLDVDALVGSFTFKASGALPDTTDRQVATSLTVGNGQTVVIGGLKQQQIATSRSRVPILSEIPLIGKLFQRTGRRSTENVLTVLITPRMVPDTQSSSGAAAATQSPERNAP